ncbi:Defensin-like protein 4 [Zea mays]|uniref:Defensin-like protein 4 n=2 Tax=Zea mays TaxID=4577 RepID=A0A3L6G551_MAIZE|nr:Defensin-like protein CAL1 precursor [Zea mays]AQK44926.1 Low-molecular-weight cysteine-rich protein LCR70 [Zea mays]PWZ43621.1 Defensin-like protein 4 [Zea mays]|eukprot:NP_001149230.2 uncharacterized protein LOC100282852 precursor [Zea mays]
MAWTSRRMVASALVFLLMLLAASEMGTTRVAEARHCTSQSHRFVGACMSKSNCENVCRTEGFPWGECRWHGIERKCHCKRIC